VTAAEFWRPDVAYLRPLTASPRWAHTWYLILASCALSFAVLPMFLLGALGVYVQRDLSMSAGALGLAISFFFLTSALQAVPGGILADRLGAMRGIVCGVAISLTAMAGLAVVHPSAVAVVLWMALAGVANGTVQPATSRAIFEAIPHRRQGLAFGIKQSSAPAATFVAGLSVPLISAHWGWPAAVVAMFGLFAVLFSVLWLTQPSRAVAPAVVADRASELPAVGRELERGSNLALGFLSACAGFGIGITSSVAAFYVPFVVSTGVEPVVAGGLLALGSVICVVVRLIFGAQADRRRLDEFFMVAVLLVAGSLALGVLTLNLPLAALVVTTLVAFGAGWGWPGLFQLGIMRRYPARPAFAAGVAQCGGFIGGILGPYAFGATVGAFSYRTAWIASGAALAVAGALCLCARNASRRHAQVQVTL